MATELPVNPESREESYLAKIAGQNVELPEKPLSRKEQYLAYIAENGTSAGGGGTSDFDDLSNRPKYNGATMSSSTNIPEVTETTVSNWGFTKNTGTYSKPSGGIPKSDLTSAVQTSLDKADTAVQQGDLTNYQLKPTTQNVAGTSATITPVDNTIYECGELADLTITNPSVTGMYVIIFTSGATPTTTTIPTTIHGFDDFAAEANMRYEINVMNNYALIAGWEVTV